MMAEVVRRMLLRDEDAMMEKVLTKMMEVSMTTVLRMEGVITSKAMMMTVEKRESL